MRAARGSASTPFPAVLGSSSPIPRAAFPTPGLTACPWGHSRSSQPQIRARWVRDSRHKPGQEPEPVPGVTQSPPGPGLGSAGKPSLLGVLLVLLPQPAHPKIPFFPLFLRVLLLFRGDVDPKSAPG